MFPCLLLVILRYSLPAEKEKHFEKVIRRENEMGLELVIGVPVPFFLAFSTYEDYENGFCLPLL